MGDFQTQGFLAPAMVNFLALLGWNDGTEQEVFTVSFVSVEALISIHEDWFSLIF